MLKYEYPFNPDEPNNTAASIYAMAKRGGERVLDVGSGPGIVARALANADGRKVTCVDSDTDALAEASTGGVHRTVVADLDGADWYSGLQGETYDTIILADVLEHLRDPGRLLRDLREQSLVDEAGSLVVSIPNANHQAVLAELLSGDFRYTATGLLDETHIRWFTLDSITRLLETNGFVVTEIRRTLRSLEQTTQSFRLAALGEGARRALTELGLEGRTYQYVLLARPASETAELARLFDAVHAERLRADHQHKVAQSLTRRLEETQRLMVAEREQFLADAASGAKELDSLEERLRRQETQLNQRGREIRTLTQSLTKQQAELKRTKARIARLTRHPAFVAVRAAKNPKWAARRLAAKARGR